jgi:hypothetical protein
MCVEMKPLGSCKEFIWFHGHGDPASFKDKKVKDCQFYGTTSTTDPHGVPCEIDTSAADVNRNIYISSPRVYPNKEISKCTHPVSKVTDMAFVQACAAKTDKASCTSNGAGFKKVKEKHQCHDSSP